MTTSKVISLILYVFAFILFAVAGFDIGNFEEDFNLVAVGLALFTGGYVIEHYVP